MTVIAFIEWSWTVINLIGVVALIWLAQDAFGDVLATRPAVLLALGLQNARRGLYASMYLRVRLLFLFIQGLSALAGIAAIIEPDPAVVAPTRYLVGFAFIVFALVMDGVSVLDLRDRIKIRQYTGEFERRIAAP